MSLCSHINLKVRTIIDDEGRRCFTLNELSSKTTKSNTSVPYVDAKTRAANAQAKLASTSKLKVDAEVAHKWTRCQSETSCDEQNKCSAAQNKLAADAKAKISAEVVLKLS
jgi:hypothetical protein